MLNSNIWPNSAPLRGFKIWVTLNLTFQGHSKVKKCNIVIGLPIHGLLWMFNNVVYIVLACCDVCDGRDCHWRCAQNQFCCGQSWMSPQKQFLRVVSRRSSQSCCLGVEQVVCGGLHQASLSRGVGRCLPPWLILSCSRSSTVSQNPQSSPPSVERCPKEASTLRAFSCDGSNPPWASDLSSSLSLTMLPLAEAPHLSLGRLHRPYEVIPQPNNAHLVFVDSFTVEGWPEQWSITVTVSTRCTIISSSLDLVTPPWLATYWLLQLELLTNLAVEGGHHTFSL